MLHASINSTTAADTMNDIAMHMTLQQAHQLRWQSPNKMNRIAVCVCIKCEMEQLYCVPRALW